jgi:hypothetical protein
MTEPPADDELAVDADEVASALLVLLAGVSTAASASPADQIARLTALLKARPDGRRPPSGGQAATARATVRQRTYRRRQRLGVMPITVEADAAIVDLLIRTGWLSECDSADKAAIGRSVELLLKDAAQR